MKTILQFSIAALLLTACATSKTAQTEIKKKDDRILIEGTKVSIVPPSGFIEAPNYTGLQQSESGSSMMVVDIPQGFPMLKKSMTKEAFLSKGVEVDTIIDTKVDGYNAIHIKGQQHSGQALYAKDMLVFGDALQSVLIVCAVPIEMEEIRKNVQDALLTIEYEENTVVDPLASVDYRLNPDSTDFKFAKFVSNSLVYTDDGKFPPQSENKTSVYVSNSLSEVTTDDKKLFSINRIKQMPLEIVSIDTINTITIDDIDGYEIYAQAKSKETGNKKRVYQVVLFSDNLYYILVGTTNGDFERNVTEMKKLIATFERD